MQILTSQTISKIDILPGTYEGDFVVSGLQKTIQAEDATIDGSLYVDAGWTIVKGLQITDSDMDRMLGSTHDGMRAYKNNTLFQDCIIHDCRQGIYKSSNVSNFIVDGCIVYYNGWAEPDRLHGHGIYTGHHTTIRNSILFFNFVFGAHVYDEGIFRPPIDDTTMENNIVFGNARGAIMFGHNDLPFYRPILRNNYTTGINYLGYKQPFYDAVFVDNYMPDGITITEGTYKENSGNVLAPEKSNRIFLIPVRNRLHVAIYNWSQADTIEVDVSAIYANGTAVQARNVQDYFVDIQTLTVTGGAITVNMQAANRTVAAPIGWTAPATTFPIFGCFVLQA